jgi:NADH-quinone oxidoreductase subunit F
MKKIRSIEKFKSFRNAVLNVSENNVPCLIISAGTCGQASGANDIMRMSKRYILEKEWQDKIHLRITGCLGFCEIEPCIIVEPYNYVYPNITIDKVPEIIDAALTGTAFDEMLYREKAGNKIYRSQQEIPFFKNQHRVILEKNQGLDPIRIFNYLSSGGYAAFEKVIKAPDSSWIIQEVSDAGLRGRGGAGFPTGEKWKRARDSEYNGSKFIICNADEGDPGAYMDRNLLEGNPHSIIEGLIIAGVAIGANQGYIYVRDEYPLAIKHASIALRQAYDLGILGHNILNSKIDFNIELIRGAGAFVCGEETALIQSIEGKMGHPRQRPPFPVERGLRGHPTCINNVETLANIPAVINLGSKQYASVGIPGNTGTKIFSLVGKIKNTGLVEVPLGTSVRTVVYDIGGGAEEDSKIKAIQTGGPSGGCLPADLFDLSIDYESLSEVGAIMGSGGMIVMDEKTCMVDVALYFTNFLQEESCGKCSICREGTQRMHEILKDITGGKGIEDDIELLEELGMAMKEASLCGLGQTAPNPVLSTLKYFKDEYLAHIRDKKCPAGVCKDLIKYTISSEHCTGCLLCRQNCPEGAISGEAKEPHIIHQDHCIQCGICLDVCKHEAVLIY